jgi:hypothetical protein
MSDPVQAQLEAYNRGDVAAFLDCYADDCLVEDGDGKKLMQGRAEMEARYAQLFASSPTLNAEIINRIRIGKYVIDEERITGRVPALRHAVAIYRVENGKIAHIRFYREE